MTKMTKLPKTALSYVFQLTSFQAFADTFMRIIKNYTAPGAGLPIKLNSRGDSEPPMEALFHAILVW